MIRRSQPNSIFPLEIGILYSLIWVSQWLSGLKIKQNCPQCRRRRDRNLIPVSGRSPGGGNGNPLQYACLEKLVHGGAWWAAVHGVAKSEIGLSD